MSEGLAVTVALITFVQGFLTAGMIFAHGTFWDGIRDVYSFGFRFWRKK